MVSLSSIAHRYRLALLALAAVCLTCIAMLTAGVSSSVAQAGGTYANCPYGDACIYAGANWNGTPLRYLTYGAHNLQNQFGVHRVFNNQYGGAVVRLCTGYNGTGHCSAPLLQYNYEDVNLTPINSIVLQPHA